mgnify:CR=1 FL=1
METNIDLKDIWNKQKVASPEVEFVYAEANKLKNKSFLKLILVNFTLLITMSFVGFIWYYYQPEMLSTKIGIVVCILAMLVFLLPFNKQISLLTKRDTEPNSKEYLQQLIKLKEMQVFQQTTMLNSYFIMLSLGIGLYLFEYVSKMPITWGVICYAVTIVVWFVINWFYIRPKTIARQNKKLNQLLLEFEKLNHQMMD